MGVLLMEMEYTLIHTALIDDPTFDSPIDKLLLICLFRLNDKGGLNPRGIDSELLAEMMCTTTEKVDESFQRLVEYGLVQAELLQ